MTVSEPPLDRRRTVRAIAAGLAGVTALLYYLIGFQVVTVLDNPGDQTVFGMIAGTAFLIGALVIWFFDRRVLMGLGALAQAWIIFMYFNLASEREPDFEPWGIVIRVVQVLLFAALTYLALRPVAKSEPRSVESGQRSLTPSS